MSSVVGSSTRSAPNSAALRLRAVVSSTTTILPAPMARDDSNVTSPIGPAPTMSTDSPPVMPASLAACHPTASGSITAAMSVGTFGGKTWIM